MSGETIYSRAADLIRDRGWEQGAGLGPNGEHCMVRALCATGNLWQEALAAIRGRLGLDDNQSVAVWNDAPERTVEDVLLVLKELHVEAGGA